MKTEFLIYRPGVMLPEIQTLDIPEEPTYEEIRRIMCWWLGDITAEVERVNVLFRNARHDMFVDERGMLKGLPVNDAATLIYHEASRAARGRTGPNMNQIHGVAIISLRRIWF